MRQLGYGERRVYTYKGRPCVTGKAVRTRLKKGWGWFDVVTVSYIDGNAPYAESCPVGRFNKAAKATGDGAINSAGRWIRTPL